MTTSRIYKVSNCKALPPLSFGFGFTISFGVYRHLYSVLNVVVDQQMGPAPAAAMPMTMYETIRQLCLCRLCTATATGLGASAAILVTHSAAMLCVCGACEVFNDACPPPPPPATPTATALVILIGFSGWCCQPRKLESKKTLLVELQDDSFF